MGDHSSSPLLGQLLLAEDLITPEELREAIHRQGSGAQMLGEVLVDMGALAERQLERALQAQSRLRGKPEESFPFVLVVEDDTEVAALVRDILMGARYRVGIARDESEAIGLTLASDGIHPDLIVLDLGLPDRGGIELLTLLRKNAPTRNTPVVVLTGLPDLEPIIHQRGLRISRFLDKPASPRTLLEAIDASIREAARDHQSTPPVDQPETPSA